MQRKTLFLCTLLLSVFLFSTPSHISATPSSCNADYNGDGQVGIVDLNKFSQNYKKEGVACLLDIVGNDCYLDMADLVEFAKVYKASDFSIICNASDENSSRLLNCDYENELLDCGVDGVGTMGAENYSIKLETSIVRSGNYSICYELRDTNEMVGGGTRSESETSHFTPSRYEKGDTYFYGFSVFIGDPWEYDGTNVDIIFQWHNIPDYDLGESSKNPNVFLAVKRTDFVLRITSDPNLITTDSSEYKEQETLASISEGWHDFVFRIKWSFENDGEIDVWHKKEDDTSYSQILHKIGPNMHNDLQKGYFKWGIYKPSWNYDNATSVTKRVIYHDNIRFGISFDAVDPSK